MKKQEPLVDEDHFTLDKLLNRTEQDLQKIDKEKSSACKNCLKENERLEKRDDPRLVLHKEKHEQEMERLKQQNKISEEKLGVFKRYGTSALKQ